MAWRRWTAEEDEQLRLMHDVVPVAEIASALGRTTAAVHARAFQCLGLRHEGFPAKAWSAEDDAKLVELYGKMPARQIAAVIGRTFWATKARARKMRELRIREKLRPWTAEDSEVVRSRYPYERNIDLARLLGRTTGSIRGQAGILGVRKCAAYLALNAEMRSGLPSDLREIVKLQAALNQKITEQQGPTSS